MWWRSVWEVLLSLVIKVADFSTKMLLKDNHLAQEGFIAIFMDLYKLISKQTDSDQSDVSCVQTEDLFIEKKTFLAIS